MFDQAPSQSGLSATQQIFLLHKLSANHLKSSNAICSPPCCCSAPPVSAPPLRSAPLWPGSKPWRSLTLATSLSPNWMLCAPNLECFMFAFAPMLLLLPRCISAVRPTFCYLSVVSLFAATGAWLVRGGGYCHGHGWYRRRAIPTSIHHEQTVMECC